MADQYNYYFQVDLYDFQVIDDEKGFMPLHLGINTKTNIYWIKIYNDDNLYDKYDNLEFYKIL